jgi:hypothetical protein
MRNYKICDKKHNRLQTTTNDYKCLKPNRNNKKNYYYKIKTKTSPIMENTTRYKIGDTITYHSTQQGIMKGVVIIVHYEWKNPFKQLLTIQFDKTSFSLFNDDIKPQVTQLEINFQM